MDAVVAGLVLPRDASMYVMSAMETSRASAVFDAVSLLLHPPSGAEAAAVDVSGAQPEDRLARLWEEHRRAPYPDGFRGIDVEGVKCGARSPGLGAAAALRVRRRRVRSRTADKGTNEGITTTRSK
ncbi:hypothetical protein [Streptomyces sp. NPDC001717]|uniref:hypothetical protein n=1 Tax=Streptomyces sp. NPDC001717 TaxID=3364604 RepID=UPI0036B2D504